MEELLQRFAKGPRPELKKLAEMSPDALEASEPEELADESPPC